MRFTKMQGLGNDYLYFYGDIVKNPEELSIKLSDRHFGVGSDGIILILPSEIADFKMRIFNADGSEAKMCGNGIRCVGKYVYDKGHTDKTTLKIETNSGIRTLELKVADGKVEAVTVDMGKAEVEAPITVTAMGKDYSTMPVSVGNPHTVTFVDDINSIELEKIGPQFEHHEYFTDGVNAEFVQVKSEAAIRMRVWERGSGITMACGTGACASVSAAVKAGHCKADEYVDVELDGGVLKIKVTGEGDVFMTGPAAIVCECEVQE